MKVGMWSKFTNPFKSDYKMTKKSGNRSYQKERMILKYKMVDYDLVYKIARIKVIIDKYILAVEKKIIN